MKKMKCKVCGKKFRPQITMKYTAKEDLGLKAVFDRPGNDLDCFDCPSCGCQIVAGVRIRRIEEETEAENGTGKEVDTEGARYSA